MKQKVEEVLKMVKIPANAKGPIIYAGTKILVEDTSSFYGDPLVLKASFKDEMTAADFEAISKTENFKKLERLFASPPSKDFISPELFNKWNSADAFRYGQHLLHKRCKFF